MGNPYLFSVQQWFPFSINLPFYDLGCILLFKYNVDILNLILNNKVNNKVIILCIACYGL